MKILGALIFAWGLSLIIFSSAYYWFWYSLKNSGTELGHAERALADDTGHGYYLVMIFLGVAITHGGSKLFRWKRKNQNPLPIEHKP